MAVAFGTKKISPDEDAYRAPAPDAHALARREKALARHAKVFSWRNVLWALALALLARLRGHSRDVEYAAGIEVPEGMRIVGAPPPPLREITCVQCAAVLHYDPQRNLELDSCGVRCVRCPLCKELNLHSRGRDVRP